MKKLLSLTVLAILLTASLTQAQGLRKGYVGIDVGPAFLTGGDTQELYNTGVQFDFDFGYLFSKNVGITANLFGTVFPSKYDDNKSIGLAGMMVGPLFSTASKSEKVEFDFKPMIGFAQGTVYMKSSSVTSNTTFTAAADAAIRWNCWNRVSLGIGANYIYGKPDDVDLSSFSVTLGVNYRFK